MKDLYTKLQIIKATIGGIAKTKENPFFHSAYFDINELLAQLEPMFQEQQLICLQPIIGRMVITQIIEIETGDKVEAMLELPELTDPQKMGSAITYYRRYTLQSLLALQAEDDDGNNASNKTEDDKITEWLTESQLRSCLKQDKDYIKKVLENYNGKNGKGMKKDYRATLEAKLNS